MRDIDYKGLSEDLTVILRKHGLLREDSRAVLIQMQTQRQEPRHMGLYPYVEYDHLFQIEGRILPLPPKAPGFDFESDAEEVVEPQGLPAPQRHLPPGI